MGITQWSPLNSNLNTFSLTEVWESFLGVWLDIFLSEFSFFFILKYSLTLNLSRPFSSLSWIAIDYCHFIITVNVQSPQGQWHWLIRSGTDGPNAQLACSWKFPNDAGASAERQMGNPYFSASVLMRKKHRPVLDGLEKEMGIISGCACLGVQASLGVSKLLHREFCVYMNAQTCIHEFSEGPGWGLPWRVPRTWK